MSIDLCIDEAREAVRDSDAFQGSHREIRDVRAALRALIQAVDELNDKLDRIADNNRLWDGS